jgi:hypothetical protein
MSKSPEMVAALDSMSKSMFGRTRSASIEGRVCVTCGQPVGEFRDALSRKEFGISGMCQKCQDSVFGS